MKKKGFTLVELLVVIAIIGVLATIIVINYAAAQAKARDSKRKSDLQSITGALGLFYADRKAYPGGDVWNESQDVTTSGTLNGIPRTIDRHGDLSSYISSFPEDPFNSDCHYLYFAIYENDTEVGQPARRYKLASIAAETLGENANDCADNAGEYAAFGNYVGINNSQCQVYQLASDNTAKNADVTVQDHSVGRCAF